MTARDTCEFAVAVLRDDRGNESSVYTTYREFLSAEAGQTSLSASASHNSAFPS